jgi:hypothetical protein
MDVRGSLNHLRSTNEWEEICGQFGIGSSRISAQAHENVVEYPGFRVDESDVVLNRLGQGRLSQSSVISVSSTIRVAT